MKRILALLACLLIQPLLMAETPSLKVTHVTPKQAQEVLTKEKDSIVVLDVRTADEYKEGHIAGAKNYDYTENEFSDQVKTLDKNKTYLVHCAAGGRSTKSLEVLEKHGFKQVYHLDGGLNAWKKEGLPTVKE